MGRLARRAALTVAAALVALAGVACGASPTPSPDDMTGVLNELAAHGLTVTDVIAGDAGCTDASLLGNGSHLTVRLAADGHNYEVYLFRWRRPSDFQSASVPFQQCVAEFEDERGATDIEVVEVSPWRAFGPAWSVGAKSAVEGALIAAGGAN